MIGKRIRYWTMNSWNESKSLAYNMKIYIISFQQNIRMLFML